MDALKFLVTFSLLIIPFAIAKLWIWVICWVTLLVFFIAVEIYSVFIAKKKTISRQFWEYKEKHPKVALACVLGWVAFSSYLAVHLWFRV